MYKQSRDPNVLIRLADNTSFPKDPASAPYQQYLLDTAAGASTAAADPPDVVYAGSAHLDGRVTSSGVTPTEIIRRSLAQNTGYSAMVEIVGIDTGNGNMRRIVAAVTAKRLTGGAILVPTAAAATVQVLADFRDGTAGTWSLAPSVDGSDFVVTVVGQSGRTIAWYSRISFDSFAPAGA